METLEQLIQQRIDKLKALQAAGTNPYQTVFQPQGPIASVLPGFAEGVELRLTGRITAWRAHAKSTFADLRDQTGRIQLFFSAELLGDAGYAALHSYDLGDIIGVEGSTFITRTNEPTVKVKKIVLLSKALRPPPEKWHGIKDAELRYRKRYADLMSSPETRQLFETRSRIVSGIRRMLDERGFLEVETPMMQPIPGGAAGRPFKTHHNALGMDLYLRIAPELYLKRLLVGGFDKVYEINRNFRNEGISTRHNPEFTMLEVYEAYGNCASMMDLTEKMISGLAKELHGSYVVKFGDQEINLEPPWKRVSFADLAKQKAGIEPTDSLEIMAGKLNKGSGLPKNQLAKLVLDWLDELLVHDKGAPVFVTDFFQIFSALAKAHPTKPGVADRFELFIGGMEVANAYTEQNDPIEQRQRLTATQELGGEQAQPVDDDFLEALEYAMPPAGGLGIGIDRLTMLLTGQTTIRDVILFPTLKPE